MTTEQSSIPYLLNSYLTLTYNIYEECKKSKDSTVLSISYKIQLWLVCGLSPKKQTITVELCYHISITVSFSTWDTGILTRLLTHFAYSIFQDLSVIPPLPDTNRGHFGVASDRNLTQTSLIINQNLSLRIQGRIKQQDADEPQ